MFLYKEKKSRYKSVENLSTATNIVSLKEEWQTFVISTMLIGKNEEPISTMLSYVNTSVPTELKRKAFVLDLAYLHMKSQMNTWSLLDNSLNGIEFAKGWGKKKNGTIR